ncbi:hypothetical protein [Stutzerimonas nitrititolerans]|uniref:hypothetical protein n=1 Tax=Stutzerimonas nitrititolerans TaxID=2482751 RepID=UPI0028A80013|nr:hypothetical protein [Stutzerimonas nitrititolerans]
MEKVKCFGQTRTTLYIWSLLAALLLWHSPASAEDYYWRVDGYGGATGSTPMQAAQAAAAANGWMAVMWCQQAEQVSRFYCRVQGKSAGNQFNINVSRFGTTCPSNTEYNPETGECTAPEEDKCLPTYGNPVDHWHKVAEVLGSSLPTIPPPLTRCEDSCTYDDPELNGKPQIYVNGDPSGVWQAFRYFGNGVSCTEGDESVNAPPNDPSPKTDKNNKCENKVCLTTDENGVCQNYTYSCTATEKHTDPGNMDCDYGEFNGDAVCVPNSPPPKMTEKETKTDVEVTKNPDGSTDTKTTTTTTTTNCTGVGSCSTSTTTNVSNNKTNADGSPGGESSTCTGPDCKDADGKSPNDKKQEQKEKEENESKVSGDASCTAVPSCTGDAIQCAILRQTHTQRCADEKFQEVDAEELVAGVSGDLAGEGFQPFGEGERGSFDLAGMIDTSSTIGGSCPALPPITFTIRGVTKSVEFGTVMAEICKYASWFSFLMVAFAMRRAAEIVAGGMA